MHAAIENADAPKLQRAAHSLKSSLRYVGATTLAEMAYDLESLGRSGVTDATRQLGKLEPQITQLQDELIDGMATLFARQRMNPDVAKDGS